MASVMDRIDYQELVEEALIGMVRRLLARTAEDGLPGAHHFYLTFASDDPGVEMADDLHAAFPEQMTVVLQHQFWDLEVDEDGFAVTLSFGGARRRVAVPFRALRGFVDPSARFAVRFGEEEAPAGDAAAETARPPEATGTRPSERDRSASEETPGRRPAAESDDDSAHDNVLRSDRFGRS